MNIDREQVIAWAREAGLHLATDVNWMPIIGVEYAEKFAALAYAAGAAAEPAYDQTALELCEVCGWKTLIPGDVCLNCEHEAAAQRNRTWTQEHWTEYERGIAAAEREACAKVCDDNANDLSEGDWDSACINCADKIRARGSS